MKVYFFSGLGADKRVFKYINVPAGFEIVHVDWIKPEPNETLPHYAQRLSQLIDEKEPFSLLGLSLGGMIVSEIASQVKPVRTILISSIPEPAHLPSYFKFAGALQLHKLIPVSMVKSAAIMKRLFTAERPEDKIILKQVIRESDPVFIKWAMDAILRWRNFRPSGTFIHIHGTRDELLPFRFTRPTHPIRKGGHLMVLNHSDEINKIIAEELTRE